jgi:hypothetical protein
LIKESGPDFKNNVIAQQSLAEAAGMSADELANSLVYQENLADLDKKNVQATLEKTKDQVFELLSKSMRPEFLNRIDEIIMFKPLSKTVIKQVVTIQLQQLQQRQQLNQPLQQQVMQQRHLKQQNQATLAALQQNALQNQAQLAALQQNVAQLQQLEQQVLAPAYTAGAAQGPSAAAATAQFQQCVQQILQQKQQLQQQIRQFQLQVEQQLAFPQQQIPPLAAAAGSGSVQPTTVNRVERNNLDVDAESSAVAKIPPYNSDDVNGNFQSKVFYVSRHNT